MLIITADDGTETPVTVVPTNPAGYERAAIAVQRDLGRQWRGHPIPGNAAIDSWTATGGTIHCNELVAAAYAATDPSLVSAVIEMLRALAEYRDVQRALFRMWAGDEYVPDPDLYSRLIALGHHADDALSRIREATDAG